MARRKDQNALDIICGATDPFFMGPHLTALLQLRIECAVCLNVFSHVLDCKAGNEVADQERREIAR